MARSGRRAGRLNIRFPRWPDSRAGDRLAQQAAIRGVVSRTERRNRRNSERNSQNLAGQISGKRAKALAIHLGLVATSITTR